MEKSVPKVEVGLSIIRFLGTYVSTYQLIKKITFSFPLPLLHDPINQYQLTKLYHLIQSDTYVIVLHFYSIIELKKVCLPNLGTSMELITMSKYLRKKKAPQVFWNFQSLLWPSLIIL